MTTPPMPDPRLADALEPEGDQPDLDRDNAGADKPRIPRDEADERIPDEDE